MLKFWKHLQQLIILLVVLILPQTLITGVDPALLDNISSELVYVGINYFTKFDQRSLVMQILMQSESSYLADMLLKNYYKH
jgi:hypothetical protein